MSQGRTGASFDRSALGYRQSNALDACRFDAMSRWNSGAETVPVNSERPSMAWPSGKCRRARDPDLVTDRHVAVRSGRRRGCRSA